MKRLLVMVVVLASGCATIQEMTTQELCRTLRRPAPFCPTRSAGACLGIDVDWDECHEAFRCEDDIHSWRTDRERAEKELDRRGEICP